MRMGAPARRLMKQNRIVVSVKDTLGHLTIVVLGTLSYLLTTPGCMKVGEPIKPPEAAEPDIRNLRVDAIEYGKDGYVASLTQQDSGAPYEMLVSIPNLEDRYVSLVVGDVVDVVVDYIAMKDPPVIYPLVIEVRNESLP